MQILSKNNRNTLLVVVSAFILSACGTGGSNEKTETLILPTLFEYSASDQQALLAELEGCSCPISDRFIEDYGIVRQQIREALK